MSKSKKQSKNNDYRIRVIAVPRKTVDHKKYLRALMALAEKKIQEEDEKKKKRKFSGGGR